MRDTNYVPIPFSSLSADGQQGLPEPPVSRPEQRPSLDVAAPLTQPRSKDRMPGTETNPTTSSIPRHQHRWGQIVVGLILALAALAFYAHWKAAQKDAGSKGTPPAVMINTATAKTGDIGVYVQALGTVTPLNTSLAISKEGVLFNSQGATNNLANAV